MKHLESWYQFQEEICSHFRSIGADAKTNVTVQGVRTKHDIDILVKTRYLGEDLTWVVEAKKWKARVNQFQVLGLRQIVADIGADRGFIISEVGFQKGAHEAAANSNVKLKTFAALKESTSASVENEILQFYRKRASILTSRYWGHSKSTRQKYDLRDYVGLQPHFSGAQLLSTINSVISSAQIGDYPVSLETINSEKVGDLTAYNFQQVTNWLNLNLNLLDEKIIRAEFDMQKKDDFQPRIRYPRDER